MALELTAAGHEVIAIDHNEKFVDRIKDRVESAIIMDSTDSQSLSMLPLSEIDVCIVAIGKDLGSSIKSVVALQEKKVSAVWARAFDQTHKSILNAIGIDKILMPEADAAHLYVKTLAQ